LAGRLRSIAGVLNLNNRFLLSSHVNPDGDSIGSTCALALALWDLGKEATVIFADEVPVQYRFIPGVDRILIGEAVRGASPDADTVGIILDCGEPSRTGAEVSKLMTRCGRLTQRLWKTRAAQPARLRPRQAQRRLSWLTARCRQPAR
jgi:nanoRNase/pAp phosphatase (c-di-AMP/oligoRNAs hydrolase)